ncbi:MAG: RelA/SpoT family protein [Patescibacteria group bacterium]|nr:RelA/SpoT family protein [Patescibacteria group bacterium]
MTIEQIINKVKENNHNIDIKKLTQAFKFAEKAHNNQKRETGEPYIQHSLHTAFVLAQIKADPNTVIAGILHDIPEDTEKTVEDIQNKFGKEIASLVAGITKLSKIKYSGEERYVESLRKMIIAMSQDLRVILIKFADRLHNLRTLDALPKNKRLRIAKETLEIYAPLAGLLGVWRLKWQMEDICFKYLYPDEFKKIEYEYEVEKKIERNKYIQKIKNILGQKLKQEKIEYKIEGRFKHLYSIYQKMQLKDHKFHEIQDVFALRVMVNDVSDCYKAMGIIHSLWKPKTDRIKDYIAVPKPNGYRSLHTTVFGPENKATEFQIRTKKMHEEALYGIAAHWHYKQGAGSKESVKKLPHWINEILDIQRQSDNSNDFIRRIKLNAFRDRIFIFSPQGDVFDLPEDSTPIDFAYAVHTEIGDKATHALVNDKMSSLDKPLKNGDTVEILIDKKRKGPNRDWLKFVKTARARNKIKSATGDSRLSQIKKIIPGYKK